MSFLEEVVNLTKQEIARRKRDVSLAELRASTVERDGKRRFVKALQKPGISVIAEFKRRSPSKSRLAPPDSNVEPYIEMYESGGARALSILTEEHFFGGRLGDLRAARESTELPLLRKDFVVDQYQVYEAAYAGADAVLLIASVLEDPKMRQLYELTRELGMDVLLEVRTQAEFQHALEIGADLIGINNRNLKTRPSRPRSFDVDIERTTRLLKDVRLLRDVPDGLVVVAESGLESRAELDTLENAGVHGALIGSALMESEDPTAKCRELTHRSGPTSASASREHALAP